MRNIRLTIEYDGTSFSGWQVQKNSANTVQALINNALSRILKEKIHIVGSGRTDSGVHAIGQVAHFKTKSNIPLLKLQRALNGTLPKEISIVGINQVSDNFHARFSATSKIYQYTILNRPCRASIGRNTFLFHHAPLNISQMRTEAKALIGKKDFKSFKASDASRREKNTIRTIKRLTISKKGDFIKITIEADGFLYKMVRNIVGTLIDVGCGKLAKGAIKDILKKKDRTKASKTAPAHGLCLIKVKYPGRVILKY